MTPPTWKPEEQPVQRALAAISSPPVAGAIVLMTAVVIAVLLVVLRPSVSVEQQPATVADFVDEATPEAPTSVYVHVTGEVVHPGVVELSSDDRVEAALEAAGGVTEHAVLDAVNLARPVVDGEQISVPNAEASSQTSAPGSVDASGRIPLNQADQATLETLPRVGPALAERIIEWRDANGGFQSVDDLLQVSGIGDKVLADIRDLVVAP